jgi:hypothetical protein
MTMRAIWSTFFITISIVALQCGRLFGADAESPSLTVIDEAGKSHAISAHDFAALPHQTVTVKIGPADSKCEGVGLVDLLQSVGVVFGHDLRGARAANVVLLEAQDGYRIALAQLEIDRDTTDKAALVIDRRDDQPLDEKEGPYRLILPGEKRPVRWIRMIRTIRVMSLKDLPLDAASPAKAAK